MTEPTDIGFWHHAANWLSAGVLGLVGILYKSNEKKLEAIDAKIDHEVRCARVEIKGKADTADVKKALDHIEKLFSNAEFDRRFTRDLYDKAIETQRLQHAEVVRLITSDGNRRK